MKKILVLINDYGMPHHVIRFAMKLREKEHCKINGIFIGGMQKDPDSYAFPSDINSTDTDFTFATDEEETKKRKQAQMEVFKTAIGENYSMQTIRENFLDGIIDETAFADILLCNDNLSVSHFSMNSLLASANCPVILIPEDSDFPTEIILTYDGGASSVHAIKQFTYLFPWWQNEKICLVSVIPTNILQMEYDSLIREWMQLHFSKSQIVVLKGEVKSALPEFINTREDNMVVMGSFGRSAMSRLFRESLAPAILQKTNTPVFIAHS